MTMAQVMMNVSAVGGGTFHTEYSGIVRADENGMVTVDSRDIVSLAAAGGYGVPPTPEQLQTQREEAAKAAVARQEAADKRAREEYPEIYAPAEGQPAQPNTGPTPAVAARPTTPARS
jgi:hypothetical protein